MTPSEQQMHSIWNRVSRLAKDGKKYIVFKTAHDLAYLYASGFVDSKKFTYQNWMDAFAASKLKEGSYLVTYDQWMEKAKYHYHGPVGEPFDPMQLEDRLYAEKEFIEILKKKVIPETIFDESQVGSFTNNLKAQGRFVNGQVNIDKEAKKFMLQFMNTYPSPMRVLRIQVQRMSKAKKGAIGAAQSQAQKSGFAVGQTAQQITAAKLDSLFQSGAATPPAATPASNAPGGLSLKDLQKKRPTSGRI